MKFVDVHCHHRTHHLDVVQVECLTNDNEWAERLLDKERCFSVGYHPWFVEPTPNLAVMQERLSSVATTANVLAIGECGLDKLRGPSLNVQETVFRMHVQVSEALHKPLIVHCVKSFNETIALRKAMSPKQPWILHGFTGNAKMVSQAFEAGLYFSLGLRHPVSFELLVQTIPIERLFFETDDSPASVVDAYMFAADKLGFSLNDIQQKLWVNYCNVFNYS